MMHPVRRLIYTGITSMICGAILVFLQQKFVGELLAGIGIACLIFGIVRSIDARSEEP